MRNDGKQFEAEVAAVYRAIASLDGVSVISENELIEGPEGSRQFDIVIRTKTAGEELLTVVECKDHTRPITVEVVEALPTKLADIKGNKGIIVSRNGFSRNAIRKAERLGITLCTVDRLSNQISNPLSNFPIIMKKILPENFKFEFVPIDRGGKTGIRFDINDFVSGMGVFQLVSLVPFPNLLHSRAVSFKLNEQHVGGPIWMNGTDGKRLYVKDCSISFEIPSEVYFGFASSLPESLVKSAVDNNSHDLFVSETDLVNASEYFVQYEAIEKLPEYARSLHLQVLSIPKKLLSADIKFSGTKRHST